MKIEKQMLGLMMAGVMILGCSACGAKERDNIAPIESGIANDVDNDNAAQPVMLEETVPVAEEAAQDSETPDEDSIYTALQNGDFSCFAGTYERCAMFDDSYGGGERLPNLILQKDGTATGGMVYGLYLETKPISVTRNEDGSYLCQVSYASEFMQEYFTIYPQGVFGENPYIEKDSFFTETVYIRYIAIDGGISDVIYYQIEG